MNELSPQFNGNYNQVSQNLLRITAIPKLSYQKIYPIQLQDLTHEFTIRESQNLLNHKILGSPHEIPLTVKVSSRKGIVEGFVKVCNRWGLDQKKQKILLGISESGIFSDAILNDNSFNLPQDLKDRIGYVISISLGLGILFGGNTDAEIEWLNSNRHSLSDLTPIEYMLQGHMFNIINIAEMVNRERGL